MSRVKKIYFHEITQKVRWTQNSSDNFKYDYKYNKLTLDDDLYNFVV